MISLPDPVGTGRRRSVLALSLLALLPGAAARAQAQAPDAGRSLMARAVADRTPQRESGRPHALLDASMFAIAPPEIRAFQEHDLVQIIVREASRAESEHELELEKDWGMEGKIAAWPDFRLSELLQLQLYAGRTTELPKLGIDFRKGFDGDGDYSRTDEFTARVTAEIIDVLPNGNLILEARTHVRNDEETSTIRVTGVCRPDDITAANTILSSQMHDLKVEKVNEGELKTTNEKGIIAKVFDAIFAF